MDLSALLGHGRENAVSSDFLAAQLQTSTRGLRDKILKARCNGEIILYAPGGHGGYFLPSDDPETAQKEMAAFYNVQPAASMGCWPSHLLPGGWGCLWGRRTLKAIYEPKAFKAYLQTPLLVCWHN